MLKKVGAISDLEVHPTLNLTVNGELVCKYTPDFRYMEGGQVVIEDVKGKWANQKAFKSTANWQVFRIKAKLVKAITGIEVRVV